MFCPECGNDCGTAKFCPECGAERTAVEKMSSSELTEPDPQDYSSYYHNYRNDRIGAIMALRVDTGMSAVDAKHVIDALFDAQKQTKIPQSVSTNKAASYQSKESATISENPNAKWYANYYNYYQNYKPDRIAAIMALRVDTGMSAVDAKRIIDGLFDVHEKGTHPVPEPETHTDTAEECRAPGTICCPQCNSMRLELKKKPPLEAHRANIVYGDSWIGIIGKGLNIAYTIWGKKIVCHCLDCGHYWRE